MNLEPWRQAAVTMKAARPALPEQVCGGAAEGLPVFCAWAGNAAASPRL
ncbi:hypothetical protein [Citrifermentans bremense]|nr:hypothetical protein [Citrifermentans bremense]